MTDENNAAPVAEETTLAPEANAEPAEKLDPNTEQPADDADDEGQEAEQPRKKSGSARLRERLDREIAEKAALAERLRLYEQVQQTKQAAPEAPPREEDFSGDYFAFLKAQAVYEAKQSVRAELDAVKTQAEQERMAAEQAKVAESYVARVNDFRKQVADYDDVMAEAEAIPVSPAMADIIRSSERGPALAYWLAKNPEQAVSIANMPPLLAARELGRIEAGISPNKPRVDSKAPAPIQPVKARAQVQKSPEDMSMEEYMAAFRKRTA